MSNTWMPLHEAPDVSPFIIAIHCDTRDFAVMYSFTTCTQYDHNEVCRLRNSSKINEKFLIKECEILPWLKEMERVSGGRNEWRCLNFTHVKTEMGWLKYIRFYRYKDEMFVVCDSYSTPFDWRGCNEQTIEKEYLNAHS